jgi:hypothetical protein
MKLLSSVIAAAILSAILPAQGATTDPLKQIYRVSGVTDNGGAGNTGIATAINCTNLSSVTELIRFAIWQSDGSVIFNHSFVVNSRITFRVSTHATSVFEEVLLLPNVTIGAGIAIIHSTSLQVHCSAMIVDAAASVPQGIALHMVRVNPTPNTQE